MKGRALLGGRKKAHAKRTTAALAPLWRTAFFPLRWARLVIDSGCTWHVHNRLEDLINVRTTNDIITDANGRDINCTRKGDLPLLIRNKRGEEFRFLLRGVRYAPSFDDTLVSVDQLWATANVDSVFRNVRSLVFHTNDRDGTPLHIPFSRLNGLYQLDVGIMGKDNDSAGQALQLKSGIHAAGSTSHVEAQHADDVAATLHRRLHISLGNLRKLAERSADVPAHIANATSLESDYNAIANARRSAHTADAYSPSHPGRLVHTDIVGPFKRSRRGYRYALIFIDDHSRFKFVYFLKAKSEAPAMARRFIARFNAHASQRSRTPVRILGRLHSDNAGEFLSREFTELLDEELIDHTTCPPHAHQLNGVAERAIGSVTALTRSYLTSSNLNVEHWPDAMHMAVDVLNRTTGPRHNAAIGPSSYELLTGSKPKVLPIMPFGCRAFALKPREQYSKTTIDPRAWGRLEPRAMQPLPGRLPYLRAGRRQGGHDLRRSLRGSALPVPTARLAHGRPRRRSATAARCRRLATAGRAGHSAGPRGRRLLDGGGVPPPHLPA